MKVCDIVQIPVKTLDEMEIYISAYVVPHFAHRFQIKF